MKYLEAIPKRYFRNISAFIEYFKILFTNTIALTQQNNYMVYHVKNTFSIAFQ